MGIVSLNKLGPKIIVKLSKAIQDKINKYDNREEAIMDMKYRCKAINNMGAEGWQWDNHEKLLEAFYDRWDVVSEQERKEIEDYGYEAG